MKLYCKDCPFAVKLKKHPGTFHCSALHWNNIVYRDTKANDECFHHLEMAFDSKSNAYNWHFIKNANYPFNLSINKEAIHRWWVNVFIDKLNSQIFKMNLCIFQSSKFILKIKDKKLNKVCFTFHWKTNVLKGNTQIVLENPEKDIVKIAKEYNRKKVNRK